VVVGCNEVNAADEGFAVVGFGKGTDVGKADVALYDREPDAVG